ncbi:S8 family peptidase [Thiomonas sp. FB-Cd]|uniref:S8 family peptidase n=1 Tax=Thiomonas sp. FB-Cd TaxID=1158292 RepID=UPI0004DFC69E|nr:S8 family peptidase [Thiomonas sp. FB-Cd]
MATRFLIGQGELLAYDIPPPPIIPSKAHPYTLAQAKEFLVPRMLSTALAMQDLAADACPDDVAVAKIDLHPAYIAKSFFPKDLLRAADLTSIGSRTVRVKPRNDVRKKAPEISDTTELFVAGTRAAFAKLPSIAGELAEGSKLGSQLAEIEAFEPMTAHDRIRGEIKATTRVFEVGLHLLPGCGPDEVRTRFERYARKLEFKVNHELQFPVGRMLFLALSGPASGITDLAQFTLVRSVRTMPGIRGARPISRGTPLSVGFKLPLVDPLSDEPSVAILDGGLPKDTVVQRYVGRYLKSDESANDIDDYNEHGLGVTSAFLFGPIEPGTIAPRPFAAADHFRVLDALSDAEDPYELYRTLGHVEDVLLSRQYQFVNLSLGPNLSTDDGDVHAWTAVLDTLLSDGETLMTVAAGNNGEADVATGLHRIQVPADSVNALSVGAANRTTADWARAAYSAQGPGRNPGRRKPDVVAFGGSPKEYFHVAARGPKPVLATTMGTSFAAPYVLRTAVGVRAVLGEAVHPLTIKALMIHAANNDSGAPVDEVGWGRIPSDLNDIIMCGDGEARILYQGLLRPGKYMRAPVPLPKAPLSGRVSLSATFCYASPVDVEDAAAYTKAGLTIAFRPHSAKIKKGGKSPATRTFFSQQEYRTEQEQRSDLGKWETVLHASDRMLGTSLHQACFDIHYNARDGGAHAGSGAELIRYALVLTVRAPKHVDLHGDILANHSLLKAIEPRVSLPLRSGSIRS